MTCNMIAQVMQLLTSKVKKFQNSNALYLDALQKSTRFFDAMRSGVLSDLEKQRVPWRGNAVGLFCKKIIGVSTIYSVL